MDLGEKRKEKKDEFTAPRTESAEDKEALRTLRKETN